MIDSDVHSRTARSVYVLLIIDLTCCDYAGVILERFSDVTYTKTYCEDYHNPFHLPVGINLTVSLSADGNHFNLKLQTSDLIRHLSTELRMK